MSVLENTQDYLLAESRNGSKLDSTIDNVKHRAGYIALTVDHVSVGKPEDGFNGAYETDSLRYFRLPNYSSVPVASSFPLFQFNLRQIAESMGHGHL